MELTDARFAHVEDGADLPERAFLGVIEGEDVLKPVGERLDRVGNGLLYLLATRRLLGELGAVGRQLGVDVEHLEPVHAGTVERRERRAILDERHRELGGDLLFLGRPQQTVREALDGLRHLA
jgi:hypothetical protein